MKTLASAGALAALLLFAASARALVIDFEDVAQPPGANLLTGDVVSRGFLFDVSTNHSHLVNDNFVSFNGTTWLGLDDFICDNCPPGDSVITLTAVSGGAFSLNSLEISEFFPPPPNGVQVLVTGNVAGGGTVTRTIVLDEIADEGGPLNDFQTEVFDASWSDLTSVIFDAITGGGDRWYALDNIQVNAVTRIPEPATFGLFAIGLAGFGLRRRKARDGRG